jgi:dienelactone hydrolase
MIGALLAAMIGACGSAPAQGVVADFSAGPPSGRYTFASWSPNTLRELMRGRGSDPVQNIAGHLFLPPGQGKGPAIVLMHGSGGLNDVMLNYWPKLFTAAGFAVFSVDTFGPRGVKQTVDDQSQLSAAADLADAFAALKLLASHPRIDGNRIAIMGFSRGGTATWRTAIERVIRSQGASLRFAAHLPVYSGGCLNIARLVVKPGVFSKAPMLWIHGDADDYTVSTPCQDYAARIRQAGTPVEFLLLKGAHHSFDRESEKAIFLAKAQRSLPTCPIEIDFDTGVTYDRFTHQRLTPDAVRQVSRTSCNGVGAHIQGNHAARSQAGAAAVDFLRKALAR